MMKAKVVQDFYATNPTQHQIETARRWVHTVMFIFFTIGMIFMVFIFMALGMLFA